jgi:oligopeptide transport system substrate-binding protein
MLCATRGGAPWRGFRFAAIVPLVVTLFGPGEARMAVIAKAKLSRRALLGSGAALLAAGGSAYALHDDAKMERRSTAGPRTLNRGNGSEPDTLDPQLAVTTWENNIIGDMFLGLMTEDAAGRPVPGAAESYSASEDGLTFRFRLRQHNWSDGRPVTAEDFVYSFRRLMAPGTAAQFASILYPIENAEAVNAGHMAPEKLGVRAVDPGTLEVRFHFQVPYVAQLMTHYATFAVPPHVVEKYGPSWTRPQNIVSNGPYVLDEWVANDHITISKNKRFYDADATSIETVAFYPTPDASAALKRYRAGEFDVLGNSVAFQETAWLRREIPDQLYLTPFMATQYCVYNFERKPFDDPRVRRALSMAIDREVLVDKITRGGETAAYSLVPPRMPNYPGAARARFHGRPMDKRRMDASDLLKEAGYGPGNRLRCAFNIPMTSEGKIVGVSLQEMWREIGVEAQLMLSEGQVHYDLLRRQDFDIGWCGWSADYLDAQDFLFLLDSATKDLNYGRYSNRLYDALMHRSDVERDTVRRGQLLQFAEQRMLDDAAIAPVYFGVTRDLVSREVKGWISNDVNINRSRYLWLDRLHPSV